jgi:hypothetical protein
MTCLKEAFTEQYVLRCETSPIGTRLINFWATGNGLTSPDIVKCCPDVSRDTDDDDDDDDDNVVSVGVPRHDWLLNLHATCTVCREFLVLYKCL